MINLELDSAIQRYINANDIMRKELKRIIWNLDVILDELQEAREEIERLERAE